MARSPVGAGVLVAYAFVVAIHCAIVIVMLCHFLKHGGLFQVELTHEGISGTDFHIEPLVGSLEELVLKGSAGRPTFCLACVVLGAELSFEVECNPSGKFLFYVEVERKPEVVRLGVDGRVVFSGYLFLIIYRNIILKYSKLLKAPLTSPSLNGRKDQFILSKGTKNNPLVKEKNIWRI